MSDALKQAILSVVRSALIALGTSLTARGMVSDATAQESIGAVMVLLAAAWGFWDKFQAEHATKEREAAAVQAGASAVASGIPAEAIKDATPAEAQVVIAQFPPPATPGKP